MPGTEMVIPEPVQLAKMAQVMSIADIQNTAKSIVTSKMIAGVTNEAEAVVKILAGQELGLGPIASVNGLYVYNGAIGMKVSLAGALLRRGGWHWDATWDDADNPTACEIVFYHPILKPAGSKHRWTVADSIRAKLIKVDGAHQKYPKPMLFNRCFMAGARIEAPDCLLNMGYELDELKEITPPPHVVVESVKSESPKPSSAPATISEIPIVTVDSIDCPLHPGTEAKLNKWGSAYSHPTPAKKDGKTVWCNTKVADVRKPSTPANNTQEPPNGLKNAPERPLTGKEPLTQVDVVSMAHSKYDIDEGPILGILKKGNSKLTRLEDVSNWSAAWEFLKKELD
jgi:hypothetical protein